MNPFARPLMLSRCLVTGFCLACLAFSAALSAEEPEGADNARYYVIIAKPKAALWDQLVSNPVDPQAAAETWIQTLEGVELVDYYLMAGEPRNLAIISVPDSETASAILYQRIATQLIDEIEIFEVIPGHRFERTLEAAKALRETDKYSGAE